MALGGVDTAPLPVLPDLAADLAAPAGLPVGVDPAAGLAVPLTPPPAPAPLAPEALFPDVFQAAAPRAGPSEAELVAAKQDARQELRQARRAVRREKAEANPEAGQLAQKRATLQDARQDFRAARQELRQARAGALAGDGFSPSSFDPALRQVMGEVPTQGAVGKQLPNISQLNPAGAELGGYANADMNCGPASVAMIARGQANRLLDGKPVKGMSDAELIMRLGAHGQTDAEGTSPNGIIAMGEALGMQTSSKQGGFDQAFYDSILAQGGSVVANGSLERDGQLSGHYVTVTGKDNDGRYLVNDPWTNKTFRMTADQLDTYLRSNQVNGGWSIGMV